MQLREHEGVNGRRDAFPFDPKLLKTIPGYNVRNLDHADERPELDELKAQIKESGVQNPLVVRMVGSDVFIVAGHRRHRACMELIDEGHDVGHVLVIHENKGTNDAERDLHLITSNSGKPLTPSQKAEVVRRLLKHHWDEDTIAKRTGMSRNTITNLITLLESTSEVQEMVKNGEVSATLAIKETRENGAEAAAETFKAAREKAKAKPKGKGKASSKPRIAPRDLGKLPKPVSAEKQQAINAINELKRLAITTGAKDKRDDEMVSVPASLLKMARSLSNAESPSHPSTPGDAATAAQDIASNNDPAPLTRLPPAPQLQMAMRPGVKELIESLKPLAEIAADIDPEKPDDEMIMMSNYGHSISAAQIRAAWRAYTAATGEAVAA